MSSRHERNLAEIERSASEASKIALESLPPAEIDRYLNPPAETPFALEYAFHLLGEVDGKTVLDLGCGTGENTLVLAARGASVIAMDISPELIDIARARMCAAELEAAISVGDAYHTGLPNESVDAVFCAALIHHLDIAQVRDEMWRILRPGGAVILKEPVRFSGFYARLRAMLPAQADISDYEHPLTKKELAVMTSRFKAEGTRYFRLPFVPLVSKLLPGKTNASWKASNWILQRMPITEHFATCVVMRLQKS